MNAYRLLADLIVLVHAAYVGFVVFGLVAIVIGLAFRQGWRGISGCGCSILR